MTQKTKTLLTSSSTKFPQMLEPSCGVGNAEGFPEYLKQKISIVLLLFGFFL